jgi:hypothetical protein
VSRRPWEPTPAQLALLRTCLAADDAVEARLREWEASVDLDDIDGGSYRLVPFLYRRISRAGVTARDHGRIKGIYARHWYLYHRDTAPALEVVAFLRDEGVPLLLLKGAALRSVAYGDDAPTRPADDVDILVPPGVVRDVIALLEVRGFAPVSEYSVEYSLRARKSLGLSGPEGSVDVNWRLHEFRADPALEDRIRASAIRIDVRGQEFATMAPTYHLLHALVHGSAWNPVPGIRWILDAGLLASGRSDVEWGTLVAEVGACGWRDPVLAQLEYLRDVLDVPVPAGALDGVRAQRSSAPGVLMDIALTRRSRLGRRLCRVAYGEYLTSGGDMRGLPVALRYPASQARTLAAMGREWRRARVGEPGRNGPGELR